MNLPELIYIGWKSERTREIVNTKGAPSNYTDPLKIAAYVAKEQERLNAITTVPTAATISEIVLVDDTGHAVTFVPETKKTKRPVGVQLFELLGERYDFNIVPGKHDYAFFKGTKTVAFVGFDLAKMFAVAGVEACLFDDDAEIPIRFWYDPPVYDPYHIVIPSEHRDYVPLVDLLACAGYGAPEFPETQAEIDASPLIQAQLARALTRRFNIFG